MNVNLGSGLSVRIDMSDVVVESRMGTFSGRVNDPDTVIQALTNGSFDYADNSGRAIAYGKGSLTTAKRGAAMALMLNAGGNTVYLDREIDSSTSKLL